MFKCCGISKPDPLNPPHRGTLNVRTEKTELLLVLFPMRGDSERGFVCFQQLLIKERKLFFGRNCMFNLTTNANNKSDDTDKDETDINYQNNNKSNQNNEINNDEANIGIEKENEKVLKFIDFKKKIKGHHTIGKISSSSYYVEEDARIEFLAQELTKNEDITSVGVVNKKQELIGIIVKKELFDLLGRPYGRDVYYYKTVSLIVKEARMFRFNENIYSVGDKLAEELYQTETKYYLLETGDGKFAGAFSTKDLLMYLSEMSQRDIRFATDIQSRIIQEKNFENHRCKLFGASKMAKGVGGDFYAVKKYNDTNWVITICDVSGKGVPAALVTAVIGGIFGVYDLNDGLKPFILKLNKYLFDTFQLQKYATGIFIDFNETTGEATVYDCGHGHLYLFRRSTFSKLKMKNGNLPLGISMDVNPVGNKLKLKKGDLILSFTDGIDEQSNAEGEDYGIKRMVPIIAKNLNKGLKAIKDEIFADVKAFRKNQPQHDDMTLIMMKYEG